MMVQVRILTAAAFIAGLAALPGTAGDWRRDLLKERGIGDTPAAWSKWLDQGASSKGELDASYLQLGSDSFREREEAQKRLIAAGAAAFDWLRTREPSADPEVRFRVAHILAALEASDLAVRDRMLRHAARSLLDHPDAADTGGVYYEWFGRKSEDTSGGYRLLDHAGPKKASAKVAAQRLLISGRRPGDMDQRFILRAKSWPGTECFPDRFAVGSTVGGTGGGEGAWHLGISIGRIKALYHPGYAGGGFRFEEVGTGKALTTNKDMGFTPSTERPQRMLVTVKRMADGGGEIGVSVTSHDGKEFRDRLVMKKETMGPIASISLDRSGREGGDAVFHDLAVTIEP